MKRMGERLRQARIDAGYSSASGAAKAHGWPPSTYIAHENGQNDYDPERAEIYGKAYKVPPEWLLLGKADPAKTGPGIDAQLRALPPDVSRTLIQRFNDMIESVRLTRKTE